MATPQQPAAEPASAPAADSSATETETPQQPVQTVPATPPELRYQGDAAGEPHINGIPADDLWPGQIDHIVLQRTANRSEALDEDGNPIPRVLDPGLSPGAKGFTEARASIVDELVASGIYRSGASPKPTAKSLAKAHNHDELIAMATSLGLDSTGTKAEIAARIAAQVEE